MKIECLTTFLDGRDRFENGDIRTVEDSRGARFVAHGWAKDLSGAVTEAIAAEPVTTLKVKNSKIGTGDNNG